MTLISNILPWPLRFFGKRQGDEPTESTMATTVAENRTIEVAAETDQTQKPHRRFWQRRRNRHPHHKFINRVSRRLNLDADQQAGLVRVIDELSAIRTKIRSTELQNKAALMALIAAPRLDQPQALALFQQNRKIMDEHAADIILAFSDLSDSLDDNQRQRLLEWVERFTSKKRHRGFF